MTACGARYAALLKTSLGTTPDDPVWGIGPADPVDSVAWGTVAQTLYDRVQSAWATLGETESKRPGTKFEQWNALVEPMNRLHEQWSGLPGLWTSAPADRVPQLVAFSEQAACVLERIDDASERLGGKRSPGTEPAKPLVPNGIGGWILGLLVVGGVGYAIYRSEKAAGP